MSTLDWSETEKVIGIIIAATPAVIAALSSLKNGKTLHDHIRMTEKPPKSNGKHGRGHAPDWYKKPDV